MQQFFLQSSLLLLSFLSVFLWQKSTLATYTVPMLGILTAIYLITNFKKKLKKNPDAGQILTVFLLNTSALLLIQTTGGLNSFLFFLLYFLCFYIAFTLIPETVLLFSLAILIFFMPEATAGNTLLNFTKLFSLLLLCPLAYFFGKEIGAKEKREKEIRDLKLETTEKTEKIIQDVAELVKNEGKNLKGEDIDRLKDIVDQSRKIEEKTT